MPPHPIQRQHSQPKRIGFTLIEVMVVISIIVVLAGILLVALGTATDTARRAKTTATLNSFRAACDAFALDHDSYPGVLPTTALGDGLRLSSAQNALLHLMGGYRVYNDHSPASDQAAAEDYRENAQGENRPAFTLSRQDPVSGVTWTLVVVPSRMGEGPFINGKPYSPYFAPKDSELAFNELGEADYPSGLNEFPSVVDSWGTPILYFRQERGVGPIVQTNDQPGMFSIDGQHLYLQAEKLGELGKSQSQTPGPGSRLAFDGTNPGGIGNTGPAGPTGEQIRWLTLLLSHPAFYDPTAPEYGTPVSAYMVMSAGKDGVYMARNDGPVDETGAFEYSHGNATHEDLDEFDDVVIYGGG